MKWRWATCRWALLLVTAVMWVVRTQSLVVLVKAIVMIAYDSVEYGKSDIFLFAIHWGRQSPIHRSLIESYTLFSHNPSRLFRHTYSCSYPLLLRALSFLTFVAHRTNAALLRCSTLFSALSTTWTHSKEESKLLQEWRWHLIWAVFRGRLYVFLIGL